MALPRSSPSSVLVVDDENRSASALATRLLGDGFQAEVCHDPETALIRLSKGGLQALITDLQMPRSGGLQLLRDGQPWLDGIAIFVVSACPPWHPERELAALGVTRQFAKPLDYDALLAALQASISKKSGPPALHHRS